MDEGRPEDVSSWMMIPIKSKSPWLLAQLVEDMVRVHGCMSLR